MDMTEAFRGEDIAKTDFFDFVVSPDADAQHAALSFKSMGIFIDGGGSQGHAASTPPPPAAPPAFSDHHQQQQQGGGGSFWASTSSCDNKDLDDLAPYCWGAEDGGGKGNTDGAIYTLTVLNGGADHAAATWYRPPEAVKDLDLDSLLSIIPSAAATTAAAPPPAPPQPTAPFPSYDDAFNNNNNNDWKLGDGNDSLLRSALEGKAPPLRRALSTPDHNSSSGASSVDDLLLSQLDAASYPEDYEKLKRIATEVAQYCGGGVGTFLGAETPPPPPHQTTGPQQQQARAKKYAKKQQQSNQQQPVGGSARKERSLHYCSICSKGFKDKYSVNVHIRTHTGEKPFACSLCGKSFRQKAHLAKHYQTHVAHKAPSSNTNNAKQRFAKTS